jgi:hypothetical protein
LKEIKDKCKELNNNDEIEKINISIYSDKSENLKFKFIDLPGLDDYAKSFYIRTFIEKK